MKDWPDNYFDVPQRSKEWFALRLGCITSSRIADAVGTLTRKSGDRKKGEPTAACLKLQLEMADEIISGIPSEHYVNVYMEKGIEDEPLSLQAYELEHDLTCDLIGYVLHPDISNAGCSPDALIGDDGGVELKNPKRTTHYKYMIDGVVPRQYRPQLLWQMACTGRKWWDFVSYCKEVPKELRLFEVRMVRDETEITKLETDARNCIAKINELVAKIRSRGNMVDALEESIRQARGSYPSDADLMAELQNEIVP